METLSPLQAVDHLQPDVWARVNRLHLRKIIAEFAHEQIIRPEIRAEKDGWKHCVLRPGDPEIRYSFRAKILRLNHWYIAADSIEKTAAGKPAAPDSLAFITEFRDQMGIDEASLPVYMEEVSSTLCGMAYMHAQSRGLSSRELVRAGYQDIEQSMTGHPRFIASNGRIGFDAGDYRSFAPEAAAPFPLLWLAGHREKAAFSGIPPLTYRQLMEQELGPAVLESFRKHLAEKGLDPEQYFFLAVHPWQWYNKLAGIFAPDIASDHLVCLGYGPDQYLPQQSIRTFFNTSHPEKFYVKTALSILNMGYLRGLSPDYMHSNPPVNKWVHTLVEKDPYLQEKGFSVLREIAAVGYRNTRYEQAVAGDSPYKKMLACLWRESPVPALKPGQQLMTMAALLHTDTRGTALLPELIRASGLDTGAWLRQYFNCYLSPLLHAFYQYDLVFMPHGENLILVLEDHVPVRAIMKDIGEEVSVMNSGEALPEAIRRLAVEVPGEARTLPLFTQVFDSIFRFLSAILVEHSGFPEERFWELVAGCILDYRQAHPELAQKFKKFSLFTPAFSPDALNRLQLQNHKQLRNRSNPFKGLQYTGVMKNPVAAYAGKNNA